jgi:flagellar biosynthesis protein FlhF
MIVEKVTADAVSEPMERIKHELGNDDIILNTRHIKVGGFFGLSAKKKVELVASVDEHVSSEPVVSKQATSRQEVVEII